jgi:ribosomal protein S18 acetylase RimI-like enzyme
MTVPTPVSIRPLDRPGDDVAWARCRTLAFLDTAYFDDVHPTPTDLPVTAIRLVAVARGAIVGVLDVTMDEDDPSAATIDTIAVHPDRRRTGLGRALLAAATTALEERAIVALDAWTRDDEAANAWYLAEGFVETYRYLHVYATTDDELEQSVAGRGGLRLVHAFLHAPIEHESQLRSTHARVHVCRRYERTRPNGAV